MATDVLVYTPEEATRALKLSRNTIYSLLRENRIAHVRIGRRILIPRSAIEDLLTPRTQPSPTR